MYTLLIILFFSRASAIVHTVKSQCLEYPSNYNNGNCTNESTQLSHCEVEADDGSIDEVYCDCEFEQFLNIWIPKGCDWYPVPVNETVFIEPGCHEFDKDIENGQFTCSDVNRNCSFTCDGDSVPETLTVWREISKDVTCEPESLEWSITPPTKCVDISEVCALPIIISAMDENASEVEEILPSNPSIMGGVRKTAKCKAGFMFSKTFKSEYDMTCICENLEGTYRCSNIEIPNAGTCIPDPNYVEPADLPVTQPPMQGMTWPNNPRPFQPPIMNPNSIIQIPQQPASQIHIGPDVSQDMISQILGHTSAIPGTLQHLLGVKNSMFSNFMSSLYQVFLYGDNKPNTGIPENMKKKEIIVPKIEGSNQHEFHNHELEEVLEHAETQNLTMTQKLWLKKREKRMKHRIALMLNNNLPK